MWIEISVTAAVSVVLWYLSRYFDNRPGKRREQFLRTREIINSSRQVLMDKVRKHYGLGQEETLLHPEGYVFPQPVPLDKVKLNLQEEDSSTEKIIKCYTNIFKKLWPKGSDTYSQAVQTLEQPDPNYFYNGRSYRLLRAEGTDMYFCPARYFDYLNTGEALLFSEAKNLSNKSCSKYRKHFPKVLDFSQHIFTPGIQTVSVRVDRDASQAHFYMLYRDPMKVAAGGKLACLLPAGEFQPATMYNDMQNDLDLWRNIMRESVEEFLGQIVNQNQAEQFDYNVSPYPELIKAREKNKISVWLLGYGANPLNYKLDFLTACIYDADTFDSIFEDMVKVNDEGSIINPIAFTKEGISFFTDINRSSVTTIACLQLAYKFRAKLGIPCPDSEDEELAVNLSLDKFSV